MSEPPSTGNKFSLSIDSNEMPTLLGMPPPSTLNNRQGSPYWRMWSARFHPLCHSTHWIQYSKCYLSKIPFRSLTIEKTIFVTVVACKNTDIDIPRLNARQDWCKCDQCKQNMKEYIGIGIGKIWKSTLILSWSSLSWSWWSSPSSAPSWSWSSSSPWWSSWCGEKHSGGRALSRLSEGGDYSTTSLHQPT